MNNGLTAKIEVPLKTTKATQFTEDTVAIREAIRKAVEEAGCELAGPVSIQVK